MKWYDLNLLGKIIWIVLGGLAIFSLTLILGKEIARAQDVPDDYPTNTGLPEVVFACKQTPTMFEGRLLGCVECPDSANHRTFNTCTGEKKWLKNSSE